MAKETFQAEDNDIRWVQRFRNYQKAFQQLSKFVQKGDLSDLEIQGLIQSFEYTHELAWNVLKDFLEHRGNRNIYGSKDATRKAFELGIIEDGETWMDMIQSRNETTHTYNDEVAQKISASITGRYFPAFAKLAAKLEDMSKKESK